MFFSQGQLASSRTPAMAWRTWRYISLLLLLVIQATARCPHPTVGQKTVPGLDATIGRGVDITLYTPPSAVASNVDLLSCTVNMTLAAENVWTDPYANNTDYYIWDQVDTVTAQEAEVWESINATLNSFEDLEAWAVETVETDSIFGMFSSSATSTQFFEQAVSVNASFVAKYGRIDAYKVRLLEPRQLQADPDFAYDVAALPTKFTSPLNWPKWQAHFKQYGTHYVIEVHLGGGFLYTKFASSAYVHAAGSGTLAAEAEADFLFMLAADGGFSGGVKGATSDYIAAGARKVLCSGAEQYASLCTNGKNDSSAFQQWANAVPLAPAVTSVRLRTNVELLPPSQQAVYSTAMITYVGWAGIERLDKVAHNVNATLASLASLPAVSCSCHTSPCTPTVEANATITQVDNVRKNATVAMAKLQPLLADIAKTLASRARDITLPSIATLANWTVSLRNFEKVLFSPKQTLTCDSYYLYPTPYCGTACCYTPSTEYPVFNSISRVCDDLKQACSNLGAVIEPKTCFSINVPQALLQEAGLSQ